MDKKWRKKTRFASFCAHKCVFIPCVSPWTPCVPCIFRISAPSFSTIVCLHLNASFKSKRKANWIAIPCSCFCGNPGLLNYATPLDRERSQMFMQFSSTRLIFCYGARAGLQRLSNMNKHHIFNALCWAKIKIHWWKQKIVFNLCPWLCRQNWILVNVPHTFPAGLPWHSIHVDASRNTCTNLRAHFQRALWFHTVLRGQKVERIAPATPWIIRIILASLTYLPAMPKRKHGSVFHLDFPVAPFKTWTFKTTFFVHVQTSNCNQNDCVVMCQIWWCWIT